MNNLVGVIYNPNSGLNRKTDLFSARYLEDIFRKNEGIVYGIVRETKTIDDLYKAAEEFKKHNVGTVGINGGDGTNAQVFTAFMQVYGNEQLPKFFPMNGGTMNNLACECKIKGNPCQILEKLVSKYIEIYYNEHINGIKKEMPSIKKRIIHVNDKTNKIDFYGSIFAASPPVVKFLEDYYSRGT
ncbi:MAG: acylglycerol kinase family protein, partial [Candidatus Woesearchaeota archaeon]|nr:acylglycerol kinase family protein [Candidatus Woesearchaeota archaeon]